MPKRPRNLTIEQARRLAKGRVRVHCDAIDPTLWRISLPGNPRCAEVHAPMTRAEWLAFLATSPLAN